jgi:hypothetical protein
MKNFVIERDLSGISMPDLHGLAAASLRVAAKMREAGDRVYYLGSTFLPEEGRCICLFEAKDKAVLEELNRHARLPVERILPAVALAHGPAFFQAP